MSTQRALTFATAILGLLSVGLAAAFRIGQIPELAGLHGPVVELLALPVVLVSLAGALVLSFVARRQASSAKARFFGQVPLVVILAFLLVCVAYAFRTVV